MELTPELLGQLNQFTRREHTAQEVYCFPVVLCDNEIDRDQERFSLSALAQLEKLFVGKTGIFDHNPSGEKQTARIFHTYLETDPERKTATGEPYTALHGIAYMVRTEKNADLIREIDAGIKKEVSISCTAGSHVCSVCGKDVQLAPCSHIRGKSYAGSRCHVILSQITDAYEWSFVAVPAQRLAGVIKHHAADGGEPLLPDNADTDSLETLKAQLLQQQQLLQQVEADTHREITQLVCCLHGTTAKAVLQAAKRLPLEELLTLRDELRTEHAGEGCTPQLPPLPAVRKSAGLPEDAAPSAPEPADAAAPFFADEFRLS